MTAQRVLIVDDEATAREVVGRYLERDGFCVHEATDGEEALRELRDSPPSLIVLDLMLPKMSGEEICRRVRLESDVPIIMLTARGREPDRLLGLELGADDYVVKPFSPRELVARVRAVLRRSAGEPGEGPLRVANLEIDPTTREVCRNSERISLTATEFDLLYFLARHPGQVFSREQLLESVWGWDFVGDASTVTVHVRRLRVKIEDDVQRPRLLKTVWSVGYKLDV
ncbi:MAG: two-component system, OmpR family [Chloroflexi bacterium]|nr:MAG: two-component system, OmpR family [Chloroflexota bacterium]